MALCQIFLRKPRRGAAGQAWLSTIWYKLSCQGEGAHFLYCFWTFAWPLECFPELVLWEEMSNYHLFCLILIISLISCHINPLLYVLRRRILTSLSIWMVTAFVTFFLQKYPIITPHSSHYLSLRRKKVYMDSLKPLKQQVWGHCSGAAVLLQWTSRH